MSVRLNWGHRRLLEAEVVALAPSSKNSALMYNSQAVASGDGRPILVRRESPPLGIPLAAMDDMQGRYAAYVQNIVQSDPAHYVSTAYNDQDSKLPERLLRTVCAYYTAGAEQNTEVSEAVFVSRKPMAANR